MGGGEEGVEGCWVVWYVLFLFLFYMVDGNIDVINSFCCDRWWEKDVLVYGF